MDDPPATPKPCCVCAAPGGKHCTLCKSRHYCSKKCQIVDWRERGHKEQCRQMAEFQDRMLDVLMPAKLKIKEEPPSVDVSPADDFKPAPRLSAVRTEKTAEASARNDESSDWRGTCAICLELLPVDDNQQTLYCCCCKSICTACSDKCRQHDTRCPLCRALPPESNAESLRRLQKHVDEGHAEAQYVLGGVYQRSENGLKKSFKRAFQLYKDAAAQGLAGAQDALGQCYHLGQGAKINYKTAAQWYRRAAEQGYPQAQKNLGELCQAAQSYDEALKWFNLAAAQGDLDALFNLGMCHANGQGVLRDDDAALRLYKRAAARGHAGAAAKVQQSEMSPAAAPAGPRT